MKKIFKLFILLGVLSCASSAFAQNISDMRLNEVVVTNTEGYVDEYGCRSGWIELYNTSYGTVNIAGCYLTTDPNNLTMYMIPKGDVLTQVKPRQHTLFWADGNAGKGTFHVNFNLDNAKEVYFVSADGKTIVDKVVLPQLDTNKSYARRVDGEGTNVVDGIVYKSYNKSVKAAETAKFDTAEGWVLCENPTPSTNNYNLAGVSKASQIQEADPIGIFLTLSAMAVTFLALIVLYFIFKNVGKFHIRKKSENAKEATKTVANREKADTSGQVSAEVYAAVSMAIHLYKLDNEAHDFETTILTINKESKTYSPWSSKIYTLRETPQLNKRK